MPIGAIGMICDEHTYTNLTLPQWVFCILYKKTIINEAFKWLHLRPKQRKDFVRDNELASKSQKKLKYFTQS